MKKTILLFAGLAFVTFKNQAQTVSDYDGNVYDTVHIGTQVWIKQNLKVTHYRNGVPIPNITDGTAWSNLTTGAYCDYDNTPGNSTTYGKLYNWYAVNDSNLCPADWHVPTDAEWTTLITYLGGESVAGGKMKETGTTHWNSPNTGATNSSGFTALPGGNRDNAGNFFTSIKYFGSWWSVTESDATNAWYRGLAYNSPAAGRNSNPKKFGFSVRCVRDAAAQINEIKNKIEIEIYPNPATDRVYIKFADKQCFKMQIYNVVGECVLQRELSSGTNEIDIGSLTKGIYIIQLTGADKTIQRKLIKE